MDVINKLYSSVSSTVSQLSGVLPGNPVTREYEISEHIASAGIGLLWKVYKGYKKSTKQEVSVFVFEKKQLERWPREDRDNMFDLLKRGVQQLTKIRHPHVLTVQHPLEESRESLAFASEPVFASLANLLGGGMNQSSNSQQHQHLINFKLHDVEIKHGILQLSEGLIFLHSDMKLMHRNLCPESIIINKHGSWKIFGFDFCISNQITTDGKSYWPHQEYNSTWHALTQPYLEYTAPEIALNSINTPDSDLFALGVLIYAIYSGGKPIKLFGKDYSSFRRFANELNQGTYPNLSCIPNGLSEYVKALLHPSPEHRPRLHELSKISFFDDVGVKTLNYLDSLYQWDNLQKSKFYKGLTEIIPTLPHRVKMQHILPCLVKEFVNSPMIPFVLSNVLLIAENSSKNEFIDQILPHLKPVMKLQDPIQILLIFMKKMNLLLKLTPADEVKANVLPMLYRALECDMTQMQELCLAVLPTFSSLIDYHATKNALLPRIKKLCLNSQNVAIKVNCLICISKLLETLDKWLVLDEIIPFLSQIQSRDPAVLMAIIGIYKICITNSKLGITKEVIATKIVPFLMPLCIENGLTINQFNVIIGLVKDMVNRVENEHRTKLEQLSTIQKDSNSFDANDISINGNNISEDVFANVKINPPPAFVLPVEKPKQNDQKMQVRPNEPPIAQFLDTNIQHLNPIPKPATKSVTSPEFGSTNFVLNSATANNNFRQQSGNSFNTNISNTSQWTSKMATNTNNTSNYSNFNNNTDVLGSLDPLLQIRNNNKVPMNQMISLDRDITAIKTPLLQPVENKNILALSQQDILDFLN